MKSTTLFDEHTARALEVAWLYAALEPASDYGDRAFGASRTFAPGEEAAARASAERVASVAAALSADHLDIARDILRNTPDATGAIARASMGDVLDDSNLLELQRFFDAVVRLDGLFEAVEAIAPCANDSLRSTARALELGRAGKFGFFLADGFADTLGRSRAALAQSQAEYDAVRGRNAAAVANALGRDEIASNEFIVMRGDLRGPLPPGARVVREAPTYLLCELDADEATLAALSRRDLAAEAVGEAEEAVRRMLSETVRAGAAALGAATVAFGEIDVLVARARFAKTYRCSVADVVTDARMAFEDGRFLPLESELERSGRAFTPLAVDLDDVAVLTGPNMGGKSVCLRTCGFIALCASYGLPVPARDARVALFDDVAWIGIGGENELGSLLSSFAAEVVHVRDVLARDARRRLVLIDEFARTTTPSEGKALLIALLARLRSQRACGFAATHLSGVPEAAAARHFAVRGLRGIPHAVPSADLATALEALAASMDYTIAEVSDDSSAESDALALASLLGLDDALIASAREYLR